MHCAPTKLAASLPEQSDCISNLNRAAPTLFYICFMAVTVFSLFFFFFFSLSPSLLVFWPCTLFQPEICNRYICQILILLLTAIFRHHVVLNDGTLLPFLSQ